MAIFKTLLFTILVPGTVTVLIPWWLFLTEPLPTGTARYLGLVPLLPGVAIYLWCAWDFATFGKGTPAPIDPPKTLVARGLYQFTRNPMYIGILSILFGEAMLFESLWQMGYATTVALLFHLFIVLYEEPVLKKQFGESYRNYLATVPRWLPSFNSPAERPAR